MIVASPRRREDPRYVQIVGSNSRAKPIHLPLLRGQTEPLPMKQVLHLKSQHDPHFDSLGRSIFSVAAEVIAMASDSDYSVISPMVGFGVVGVLTVEGLYFVVT